MEQKITVEELINALEAVEDKALPINCIALLPHNDSSACQYSGHLDNCHLTVDDDGDEVMLTMDFNS